MEIKQMNLNNLPITFIKTPKFKTTLIEIMLVGPFTKENATKRSLLTQLLLTATKNYPTKKAIAHHLFELYDASIGINSFPSYDTNVTYLSLELINEKYAPRPSSLLSLGIDFISEMLFNPHVDQKQWNNHDFEEQKRILKASIENVYNHKGRYATQKLIQTMCADEITGVSSLGDLADLELIDAKSIYDFYQEFINNELAHIYVVGDLEEEHLCQSLSPLSHLKAGANPFLTAQEQKIIPTAVKKVIEKQPLNQAKLVMGFRTLFNHFSPLNIPSIIFNSMFGGNFSSDLVQTIREKHSLCYSISSDLNPSNKIMLIHAGIDGKNSEQVQTMVIEILKQYQKGIINEQNFQIAKDLIISELNSFDDHPEDIVDFYSRNDLINRNITISELIEKTKAVTLAQIQEVANGVFLDSVFLLANEEKYD